MDVTFRRLDDVFTYPCTKADVREAFGTDLLRWAWFEGDHYFMRGHGMREISGRVILSVSISMDYPDQTQQAASLHAYRIRKEDWSDYLHWQVREAMRASLRPWVEAMFARPEIAWGKSASRFIELREGRLYEHQRPKSVMGIEAG